MLAIVRALLVSNGSARPKAVYAAIEANGERRYPPRANNVDPRLHYENAVRFARQELADGGVLQRTPGIWTLVDPAAARALSVSDAVRIIGENRRKREQRPKMKIDPSQTVYSQEDDRVLPAAKARLRSPGPTTGPKPSRYETSFKREDGPASTYLLRFGSSNIWKIGYAGDVSVRLNHVNQHLPVELIGVGWRLVQTALWPSQDIAYAMEQALFHLLADERTMFERVRCSEARIVAAWEKALVLTGKEAADVCITGAGASGPRVEL